MNIIPEMLTRTNMYNDVVIERAKSSDAKELLDFWKIVGGETDNLSFGSEGKPVTESEEFEKLKSLEESTVEAYFVARKDSAIIGTAHYTANDRNMHTAICKRKRAWNPLYANSPGLCKDHCEI